MLAVLVVHGFVLNLAALVAGFHGAEHAPSFGDAFELAEHCLFHQIGQFFNNEGTLIGIFIHGQAPFLVDDQLNCHGTAH